MNEYIDDKSSNNNNFGSYFVFRQTTPKTTKAVFNDLNTKPIWKNSFVLIR